MARTFISTPSRRADYLVLQIGVIPAAGEARSVQPMRCRLTQPTE